MSGFSVPLLTEFRFFCVFLCLAQCLTWDRVWGISVSIIIYKMGINTTCLNRVSWSCVWIWLVFGGQSWNLNSQGLPNQVGDWILLVMLNMVPKCPTEMSFLWDSLTVRGGHGKRSNLGHMKWSPTEISGRVFAFLVRNYHFPLSFFFLNWTFIWR